MATFTVWMHGGSGGAADVRSEVKVPDGYYVLAGTLYPIIYEPRCVTCKHPRRLLEIDEWLWAGVPYSMILDRLGGPEAEGIPSHDSLGRHNERHLPRALVASRALVQVNAEAKGIDLDEHVGRYIDAVGTVNLLAHKAVDAVVEGRVDVANMGHVIQITDLMLRAEQLQQSGEGGDADLTRLALMRVLDAVALHAPPEVLQAIGDAVKSDEVLQAIDRTLAGRDDDETRARLQRELTGTRAAS